MRWFKMVVACWSSMAIFAGAVAAQELTIKKLEAARFDELVRATGSPHKGETVAYDQVVKPSDGKALVRVTVTLEGKWAATPMRSIQVATKEIAFSVDGGGAADWAGQELGEGVIDPSYKPSVFVPPPTDATKPKVTEQRYCWYVSVPKDAKRVTVKVGTIDSTAEVPNEVTKVDPAEWLTFQVKSAKLVDTVPGGGGDAAAGLSNPGGKLLVAELEATAKKANSVRPGFPDVYSFYTPGINVRARDKVIGVEGYIVNAGVIKPGQYSVSSTAAAGKWLPMKLTAVFKVPAGTDAFDLLWQGRPVGQAKVR